MSPVLLDHRNLKWIWLSVCLFVFMGFLAGYILGFEKSNNKWLARLDPTEITLPNILVSDLTAVEPQIPEIEEPGANIDVDSVDEPAVEELAIIAPEIEASPVETAAIVEELDIATAEDEQKITAINNDAEVVIRQTIEIEKVAPAEAATEFATTVQLASEPSDTPSGIGEPEQDEPLMEISSIVDDASEETARYSVQVGMYKRFDNAATKVEALLNLGLSAYINDYKNKNGETRYNVRFGYFQSFSNAGQALKIYQQSYSGAGYIARFVRE